MHWVLFNIPAASNSLAQGVSPNGTLPSGSVEGTNDFATIGYGGPCPPTGTSHRYYFRLYALDTTLALTSGATRAQVDQAMSGHILAQTSLMGTFAH